MPSLTPLATTSRVSPFTKANGTLTGPSRLGTTHAVYKERRELDDEKKMVTFRGLEGHVMEQFRVFDIVAEFIPKSEDSCVCKSTMIWETRNDEFPERGSYMKLFTSMFYDMEDQVLEA
ncbi:hypothetical protein DY000_02009409 [Brassica cretica]|uniref:Bet v I/Major latex protein domain-containing protein n=1 Tax=Brassica cretica TaxID=69181 RepID=A0ABQ7CGN6_BRACR|nr:hypothetical protein DY000_02009409 [Brassica cretica]